MMLGTNLLNLTIWVLSESCSKMHLHYSCCVVPSRGFIREEIKKWNQTKNIQTPRRWFSQAL